MDINSDVRAMRQAAQKGEDSIYDYIATIMHVWNELGLAQLQKNASYLSNDDPLQSSLKNKLFLFVARRRRYQYLQYLNYKLVHKQKDVIMREKYFERLTREEQMEKTAISKNWWSIVKEFFCPKPKVKKLKEMAITSCLFEIPDIRNRIERSNWNYEQKNTLIDWIDEPLEIEVKKMMKVMGEPQGGNQMQSERHTLSSSKDDLMEKEKEQ